MLTAAGCLARRQRLWNTLPTKPPCLLVHDPRHLVYLANYWQSPFSFHSNDANAVLMLTPDGHSVLVGDNLAEPYLAQAHVDETIAPVWYRSVETPPARDAFLMENVKKELTKRQLQPGPEPAAVLAQQRRTKDPDELEILRLSVKAGEAGMAAARREAKPGMTEMELYWLVQRAACEAIGMQAVVYGDFISGPRTLEIGGPPSQRKIEKGDLVLLDFSTVVWHYRADFAMTFVCGDTPSPRQHELHAACQAAMTAGEKMLRPGVSGQEVYHAVRRAFEARQLEGFFPHHAGHGIGLGHPEPPFLVPASSDTLIPGDVVTLEPGLYVPGVGGIRLERNYLITTTGHDVLSKHSLALEQAG